MKICNHKMRSAVAAALALAVGIPFAAAKSFSDVPATSWYYDAVNYATSNNLFNGTSDTEFSPNVSMTRGMFVTVLGRVAKVNTANDTGSSFSDVSASAYYAPYVKWASEKDIVSGTGENRFSPNGTITREQMAIILYRYTCNYHSAYNSITAAGENLWNAYADKGSVSHYASGPIKWALEHGILSGYKDNTLRPKNVATRAEVATIFKNYNAFVANDSSTVTPPETTTPPAEPNTGGEFHPTTDRPIDNENGYSVDEYLYWTKLGWELDGTHWLSRDEIDEIDKRTTGVSDEDENFCFLQYDIANAVFDKINDYREENGINRLMFSIVFEQIVNQRAIEVRQVCLDKDFELGVSGMHERPDGRGCETILSEYNLNKNTTWNFAENALSCSCITNEFRPLDNNGTYSYEFKDVTHEEFLDLVSERIVNQWKNSAGHNETMLNSNLKTGAVGVYTRGNRIYAVQVFAGISPLTINEDAAS